MYMDLKDEDTQVKTMVTDHWYPSCIKRAYTLYVKAHVAPDLLSGKLGCEFSTILCAFNLV